jgi:hypothetical protein
MKNLESIIIVFGFGRDRKYDERTKQIVTEKLIPELLIHPDAFIITSGGVKDSLNLNLTEAQQLKDLLIEIGIPPHKIILEDKSIDAAGNIEKSGQLIKYLFGEVSIEKVNFMGEAAREKETLLYAEKTFRKIGLRVEKFDYWSLYLLPPDKRLTRERKGRWLKYWITRKLWHIYRLVLLKKKKGKKKK